VFVEPDAYYKMQGGKISFTGSHFYPNEMVTVTHNGASLGTIQASSAGTFTTGSYDIPYSAGRKTFTFRGAMSNRSFPVDIWVDGANPWLGLSSYYAGDNAPITITGNGFGSTEHVQVWFNGQSVGTVITSTNGEFTLTTTVPESTAGQKIVKAQGMKSNAIATQTFSQAF
jgi:hypothetical protein